ncbi:MAG: hypothetical protein Kow0032_13990 [Methyloligellaceae bacterium]
MTKIRIPKAERPSGRVLSRLARDFCAGLALFLAVFALAAFDSREAWPHPAETSPQRITPHTLGIAAPAARAAPLGTPAELAAEGLAPAAAPKGANKLVQGYQPPTIMPLGAVARPLPLPLLNPVSAPSRSASGNWRLALIAIMAIVFAGMSALTMNLWRSLHREIGAPAGPEHGRRWPGRRQTRGGRRSGR